MLKIDPADRPQKRYLYKPALKEFEHYDRLRVTLETCQPAALIGRHRGHTAITLAALPPI
jgi:hypothetical protein